MLFAYIGPETMMPVASIIAAVAGVFMMFGRNVMGFFRYMLRSIMPGSQRKPTPRVSPKVSPGASATSTPHQPETVESSTANTSDGSAQV